MRFGQNKEYRISLENEDRVTPEETLLDSGSRYSDIEQPIPSSIFRLFLIFFSVALAVLSAFLFKTAILDHPALAKLAMQNKSANLPLPPPRGMITDKNGQQLVKNIPVFNLLAISRELKESSVLDDEIGKIAGIIGQDKENFRQNIKNQIKTDSSFFAKLDLTKEQALSIEYLNPKGFYIIPDTKREYVDSHKISQIMGYTGKVSRNDLSRDDYYFTTDIIGRLGIESRYEEALRGTHGNIFFTKDESNYITKDPLPGNTVVLNIDHDLQVKLYDSIFEVLREAGLSRAAGIIQDPRTGAVLALVSFPDFDNNIFASGVSESEYQRLFESKAKPLFNRIISGQYNPGSTIKPFMGMAALQDGIVTPETTIQDCVSLTVPNQYHPENSYTFKNWRPEYGTFNLKKALANSCNIYFFTAIGGHDPIKGLGAEKITNYLKQAGVDSTLGIDIGGEQNGFVPTPDEKLRDKGEQWYLGDTYNISIGQGDLLVTPLWLNSYVSAIANGGKMFKPEVAQKVIDENKEIVEEFKPEVVRTLPFSENSMNEVKKGMREVVLSGTAQIFQQLPVEAAAKTGTAEVVKGKSINSLFTVFAPYNNPQISMTILIEGSASNQGLAIRAAYNTLKWYFER